jgi:DNA polymerase III subunit delta'
MSEVEELLPWHTHAWQHLQEYIQQNRVPHALLISGSVGLGKQLLSLQYAAALLCLTRNKDQRACGQCHSCVLLKANTHPDFLLIGPANEEKSIGIDLIRDLIPLLALKPQYSGYRVVVVNSAEMMTNACANAFLKCLEEPNLRTIIVLVCNELKRLPATILSRCQKLTLREPERNVALNWLKNNQVTEHRDSLLIMAQGAPLRALRYSHEQLATVRQNCFKDWLNLSKQISFPVPTAEHWMKFPLPALLQWVSSWLADIIKSRYTSDKNFFYNQDLFNELQLINKKLDLVGLYKLYDDVLTTQKDLQTTLNKQLLIESILINWSALNNRR